MPAPGVRLFAPLLALGLLGVSLLPARAAAAESRVPASAAEVKLSYAPVVKRVAPAVVNIYTRKVVRARAVPPMMSDPVFRHFFGDLLPRELTRERVQNSLGSGVLIGADGLIVTNHHVVEGADEILVVLHDRREFSAALLGSDPRTDLAVLRLRDAPGDLPTLPLGDSDALEVGDLVLAVGNPFGVGQTVSSGIVSALSRATGGASDVRSFIQTDAPINPGNSGGALVTLDGALIGINTAIYSRDGANVGIGFAIPANLVRVVAGSLATGAKPIRPWLGADGQAVGADLAVSLGLPRPGGVLINRVLPGSPAARAGLRVGDVVVAVDGHEVADLPGLGYRLATLPVGGEASLSVMRDGRPRDLAVPLEAPPDTPPRQETELSGRHPLAGSKVANLNPALAAELGVTYDPDAVVVLAVARGGYAMRIGIEPGDVVQAVNGTPVKRVSELLAVLNGPTPRGWVLSVRRGDRVINFRI